MSSKRVRVTFDDRERALVGAFRSVLVTLNRTQDFEVVVGRLPLGDVELVAEGATVLVERKRDDDLMASLFDGRLAEQGARLRTWCDADERRWVVVLIEGLPAARHASATDQYHRHFLKTMVRETVATQRRGPRHLLLRATGATEAALFLLTLWKTLVRDDASSTHEPTNPPVVLPAPPRRHGSVYVRQLSCVSGISPARARDIAARYPGGMAALCAAIATDGPSAVGQTLGTVVRNRPAVARLLGALTGEEEEEEANGIAEPHCKPPHGRRRRRTLPPAVAGTATIDDNLGLQPPAHGDGTGGTGATHPPTVVDAESPVLPVSSMR